MCVYAPVNLRVCVWARAGVFARAGIEKDGRNCGWKGCNSYQIKLHSMQYGCDNTAFKLENRASFGRHESSDPLAPCHKHTDKGSQ